MKASTYLITTTNISSRSNLSPEPHCELSYQVLTLSDREGP